MTTFRAKNKSLVEQAVATFEAERATLLRFVDGLRTA